MKNPVLLLACLAGLSVLVPLSAPIAQAQLSSITPAADGTGTTVTPQDNRFDIGGGRSSRDRANLFQSFDRFGLSQGEVANFLSTAAVRNILGRVVGGDPSVINGLIQVTGGTANLYLLNPAGIVFGVNASLNVPASFTATTANGIGFGNGQWFNAIDSADYAALVGTPNTFAFTSLQPGAIANLGNLAVRAGQSLTLLGGTVLNTGQLTAPGGKVTIAAVPGQTLVRLSQQGSLLSLEFSPLSTQAPLPDSSTPPTLPQLLTGGNLGNATGVTVNLDGTIQLTGSTARLSTAPGTAIVSGQVSVASNAPPATPAFLAQIAVLGDRVSLQAATLDASGLNGGTLRLGGGYQGQGTVPNARFTDVDANTVIRADAIAPGTATPNAPIGNGGTVIVWSNDTTNVGGMITAQGGSSGGNGGLVETSGKQRLTVAPSASVSTYAPFGQTGIWLLDPTDLTVAAAGTATLAGGPPLTNTPTTATTISAATIVAGLNGNNVNLQATNSITVNEAINASGNGSVRGNLTLTTPTVTLNQPITLTPVSTLSGTATTVNVGAQGTVQNGVDVVATGGTVNLAVATYTLTSTVNIAKSLTLNGISAGSTTVSGNNTVRVFNISGSGTSVTIDRLTIANGNQNGDPIGGGGLLNNTGNTLTLNNSIVRNNSSAAGGGGIRNDGIMVLNNVTVSNNIATNAFGGGIDNVFGGTLTLNNSVVIGNQSNRNGGGIDNYSDATNPAATIATLNNSIVTNNSASGSGGGVYYSSANANSGVTLNNTTISNNTAGNVGGGIAHDSAGNLTVNNSTISSNRTTNGDGGGIYNSFGTLAVTNSTISGNSTTNGSGGGIRNRVGTLAVTNSTISGNSTDGFGGGIFSDWYPVTITNSTLNNNSAAQGGAIYNTLTSVLNISNSTLSNNVASDIGGAIANGGGTVTINNSTLSKNQAANSAGGIANSGPLTISNSIVAGNTAPSGREISSTAGEATSNGNNLFGFSGDAGLVGVTAVTSDIVPTVPLNQILSITLANNGGATQTLALLPGSPAINAGGTGATSTDQRGIAAVGIRDIGAFESRGFTLTATSGTPQSTLVTRPFSSPLVATVTSPFGEPVAGGVALVTFTAPASGATATLTPLTASINSDGQVSVNATANVVAGAYTVTAFANGVTGSALFRLSNLPQLTPSPTPQPTPQPTPPEQARRAIQQDSTPTYPAPPKPAAEVGQIARVDRVDTLQTELESSITEQFASHLELKEQSAPKSLPQVQDALQKIQTEAGVKPALFYISLLPSLVKADISESESDNKEPKLSYDAAGNPVISQVASAEPDLVLILVPASGSPILRKVSGVTRSKVFKLALTFRNEVADPSKTLTRSYLPSAKQLYSWLVKPMEAELKAQGIDTLMFIMDTNLRFLPLAALYDEHDRKFLVEKYSIGLLPSLSLTDLRYGNVRTAQVLAAGASTFEDANQNPLLGVKLELSTILKGDRWQGRSILDQDFTSSTLQKQRQEQPFGIIHLATHGEFLPGNINQSYIQLANEKLRLNQIRTLGWNNPPAELVVLSACQMALGDEDAELGFAGFAVKAGVKSALASLWNISDEGTIGLMARFYEELRQVPTKAGALRQAQIAMLKGQVRVEEGKLRYGTNGELMLPPELAKLSQQTFSHPYYWSAFTMIGSPW